MQADFLIITAQKISRGTALALWAAGFFCASQASAKVAPALPPPAGDYQCYAWSMTGSSKTPRGHAPTFGQTRSPLGTISLDGEGAYNNSSYKTSGRYTYSSKRGRLSFISGKLAPLKASAELGEQEYRLRFSTYANAPMPGDKPPPDQVCVLKDARFKPSKEKVPDLLSEYAREKRNA